MHDLFGERFLGVREAAWHELGTVIKEPIPATEAFKEYGLDYTFVKAPIGYTLPDGTFVTSDNRVQVLRTPTHDDPQYAPIGIQSKTYSWIENIDIANGIDLITKRTGWQLETCGALGKGETIFASLKTDSASIKGDEIQQFFLVSDAKAAGRALRVGITDVRVVCRNTLLASDASSQVAVNLAHRPGLERKFDFWMDMIASLEKARTASIERLNEMASVKISDEQAKAIFTASFPMPKTTDKSARLTERLESATGLSEESVTEAKAQIKRANGSEQWHLNYVAEHVDGCVQLYDRFNSGSEQGGKMSAKALKALANTPYAALQAVTELCDWGGNSKPGITARETLFGRQAMHKQLAWNAALNTAYAVAKAGS